MIDGVRSVLKFDAISYRFDGKGQKTRTAIYHPPSQACLLDRVRLWWRRLRGCNV
jgi:hypothetical protein